MQRLKQFCITVLLIASIAGCSGSTNRVAISERSNDFRSTITPPAGSARVYVLPTLSKGLYSDLEGRAAIVIYHDGSNHGAGLGATNRNTFVAFDIAPGSYDLAAYADNTFSRVTRSMTFAADTVYVLRPVFFRSAQDMPAKPTQVKAGLGFDSVPMEIARAEISRMSMAAQRPTGVEFLAHTYTDSRQTPPAPSSAGGVDMIERKLRDLQKLLDDGLITQAEYTQRRKAVLDEY